MVHSQGKVPHGTILRDNEDGTYDIEWESMPSHHSEGDESTALNVEYRVPARSIKRAKAS
jgi:hypothetical protein